MGQQNGISFSHYSTKEGSRLGRALALQQQGRILLQEDTAENAKPQSNG